MTPQTQFTPGPWSINPRNNPDWHIEAETGYRVATVYMGDSVDRDEFTQANARLIAAAPSLYASLQAMLECAEIGDLESLANAAVNARKALDLANA